MSQPSLRTSQPQPRWVRAVVCLVVGVGMASLALQSALEEFNIAGQLLSHSSYERVVLVLGGRFDYANATTPSAIVDLASVVILLVPIAFLLWIGGGLLIALRGRRSRSIALTEWAASGWLWWIVPGLWELLRIGALAGNLPALPEFLTAATGLCWSVALAGWLATLFARCRPEDQRLQIQDRERTRVPTLVWLAIACYVVAFTTMNWQLYRGLLVPHGDSAMYEEHLWNLEHGKGFRSYLDRGLFLGEHIQVIHVLLVPLHLVWSSLMSMELCQSLALACGALPVFWMARRHTGSTKCASLLSIAYLLYFPMHFLDVSIDLKTFRPGSFGTVVLLFALDQMERRRYLTFAALLLLTFSAQEDFAIVVAPLGLWMALRPKPKTPDVEGVAAPTNRSRFFGLGLALVATAYFFLVVTVVLPWFRGGVEIHYVGYLSKYGKTAGEVVKNMLTEPGLWLPDLLNARVVLYALFIVAPLGFLPLFSLGRVAVAFPLFVLLCLNELTKNDVYPQHHFHAPLVPIVLWSAAAGLGHVARRFPNRLNWLTQFAWTSALAVGFLISIGPLGWNFWDSGSSFYWRSLYIPGKRAEMFAKIEGTIPSTRRVASTDFVHPRYTHFERSYDYSDYPRAVNDFKPGAPADTDYIVIDTQHRYSKLERPEQIPEFRDHPEQWEVVPNNTEGYFIILRRKAAAPGRGT